MSFEIQYYNQEKIYFAIKKTNNQKIIAQIGMILER